MCERLVGIGHSVSVFLLLHGRTGVVEGVEQFVGQLLRHRLAASLAGQGDQPA